MSVNRIEEMLSHYLAWPAGHMKQNPEAQNLARSIARLIAGEPWQLSAQPAPMRLEAAAPDADDVAAPANVLYAVVADFKNRLAQER